MSSTQGTHSGCNHQLVQTRLYVQPYTWQLQSRRLHGCLLSENANTADTVLTCFLFSVNTKWKCKAVLWKSWNRHLLWLKIISGGVERTVPAKQPQKVSPGLKKAKHGLYEHQHNVFFYSGLLLAMTFVKIRTHFHLEVTSSNVSQGTNLWLQPKIHCMSSPTDSKV